MIEAVIPDISAAGIDAVTLGLLAGGCRLICAAPGAYEVARGALRRLENRLSLVGGALVQVQTDTAATLMAAGAALSGARAAALVVDSVAATNALAGLDDLGPLLVDVSGHAPLQVPNMRSAVAPHSHQAAFEAGRDAFSQMGALHGPGLIMGLPQQPGVFRPSLNSAGPVAPIHHDGPDDPEILLISLGPSFPACVAAREQLEDEGVQAAHLHIVQLLPFPGAIIAPAITSAARVLVVEPGGPGTLAELIRSQLGAPARPFGELHRLAGAPLGSAEIALRAQEVMAL